MQALKVRRAVATAATLMLVAACGTTVSGSAAGSDSNLGASPPTGTDGSRAAGGGAGSGSGSGQPGDVGTSTAPPTSAGGSGAAPTGPTDLDAGTSPVLAQAPGKLAIGISVVDQAGANALLGAAGSSTAFGDGEAAAQALVAYLNASGGIGGRRIVPTYVKVDVNSEQPGASLRQAECTSFTEDHHVFAVVDQVDAIAVSTMASCLAKHRTVYVNAYTRDILSDGLTKQLAPFVYQPGDIPDAGFATVVDQLVSSRYFDAGYRLGVFSLDDPITQQVYQSVIKPRLRQHGIVVTSEATIPKPTGLSDAGAISQASASAVLKFKSAGVDHVLLLSQGGAYLFMQAAEQQGYRPRYSLTSKEAVLLSQSVSPAAQWHGAVLAGWTPTQDVPADKDPGGRPQLDLCMRVIRSAGVAIPTRTAEHYFAVTCDGLFFLRAALAHAPAVDPQGLLEGATRMGTSFSSALTFGTRFGRQRFAAADLIRIASYQDSCACFGYAAAGRSIG